MSTTLSYPPRISLAQTPTPLISLRRLSTELSAPVWCKRDDLTGSVLTGNKVRKLEFILADALAQGCDTLVTCGGLQSNHCRATALVAAEHGLDCQLLLRGENADLPYDGNLLLGALAGAAIHTYSPEAYARDFTSIREEHLQRLRTSGKNPYWIPTGASNGLGLWGYVEAARELAEDCRRQNISAPVVVCAAGSGGTLAGLAAGLAQYMPAARVVGMAVCDDAAYFERRVAEDISAWLERSPGCGLAQPQNYQVMDAYIGPGYAVADEVIYRLIQQMATLEGLMLDPVYTAKAFYGMLQEWHKGTWQGSQALIFVHTGGVFGLYPQRELLARAIE